MTENGGQWERELVVKLATAALKEQRRARLWGIFWKLLTFAYLTVFLLLAVDWKDKADVGRGKKHTAMVEVSGIIAPGTDASAEKVTGALQAAFKDKNTRGVVVRINSPGGSPVQAQTIYDEMRRLLTAGENKAMLDPFSPLDERHKEYAQRLMNDIHQQFIGVVREGRGKRLKDAPEIFSGLIWTGEQSIELGLADGVGSLEYVAREVVKAEDIVDFSQKENLAEKLAKRFGAGAAGALAELALRYSPGFR